MEDEVAHHAVGVYASEDAVLAFCYIDQAQYKSQEGGEYYYGAGEAFLFAYCAEYKVCVLFGHVFELCLCPVEESFSVYASGADGYFALIDVVAGSSQVFFYAQGDFDAELLVIAKYVCEYVVYGKHEDHRGYYEAYGHHVFAYAQVQHHYGYVCYAASEHGHEVYHAGHLNPSRCEPPYYQAGCDVGESDISSYCEVAAVEQQHYDEYEHDG